MAVPIHKARHSEGACGRGGQGGGQHGTGGVPQADSDVRAARLDDSQGGGVFSERLLPVLVGADDRKMMAKEK